jgi:hypothetical protein
VLLEQARATNYLQADVNTTTTLFAYIREEREKPKKMQQLDVYY